MFISQRLTGTQNQTCSKNFVPWQRAIFKNLIIVAGKYTQEKADWVLDRNYADLVAFGRWFIANPDLPARLKNGAPLSPLDDTRLYGGGRIGYTDYPVI